jgi:ribosomal protein S18 acetylase RimI-like enzyme
MTSDEDNSVVIKQIGAEEYSRYAEVTPEFMVMSVLEVEPVAMGIGGLSLRETPVAHPYLKYDQDEDPPDWARKYDLADWGIFLGMIDQCPAGGAAVAPPTPGIVVTEGREDVAALWDIRVSPQFRGRGVGTALLERCAKWAKERGFAFLGIETQNANAPACRFYARNGCELVEIRRFAYASCPKFAHEAMLIWRLRL